MNNLFPFQPKVNKANRLTLLKQQPKLIWFTGLSGSGKSTLAVQLEAALYAKGYKTYLLDGDIMRVGLNKDLSFTNEGRIENIRRIGEVSKLMLDAGIVVLSAFISPFEDDRKKVKDIVGEENYIEVFVNAPLAVCEERDVKGLYKKARAGEIKNFTGIDSPYENPSNPTVTLHTDSTEVDACMALLLGAVELRIKRDE